MHTSLGDIADLDGRAVLYSVELAGRASVDSLAGPTPCSNWALGDLLGHMTAQHLGFAAVAEGRGRDLSEWAVQPSGRDAVSRYRSAAEHVLKAFAAVSDPDQEFALPEFGPAAIFPAPQAIGFHFIDYVVHGWDVARSLGIGHEPEPDVLKAALPIALAVPTGESRLRPGAAFAPALAALDDASVLDQILSALGRSPHWPA